MSSITRNAPAMGGDDEVVVMDGEVATGTAGRLVLQRLPVVAIIEAEEHHRVRAA